jgi:hypothetical protein
MPGRPHGCGLGTMQTSRLWCNERPRSRQYLAENENLKKLINQLDGYSEDPLRQSYIKYKKLA